MESKRVQAPGAFTLFSPQLPRVPHLDDAPFGLFTNNNFCAGRSYVVIDPSKKALYGGHAFPFLRLRLASAARGRVGGAGVVAQQSLPITPVRGEAKIKAGQKRLHPQRCVVQ